MYCSPGTYVLGSPDISNLNLPSAGDFGEVDPSGLLSQRAQISGTTTAASRQAIRNKEWYLLPISAHTAAGIEKKMFPNLVSTCVVAQYNCSLSFVYIMFFVNANCISKSYPQENLMYNVDSVKYNNKKLRLL